VVVLRHGTTRVGACGWGEEIEMGVVVWTKDVGVGIIEGKVVGSGGRRGRVAKVYVASVVWARRVGVCWYAAIMRVESRRYRSRHVLIVAIAISVVHSATPFHPCGATCSLTAFGARGLSLGLGLLGPVATLVGLLTAVARCGFDAFADSSVGQAPHEAFAGLFAWLVNLFEGLGRLVCTREERENGGGRGDMTYPIH